MRGARRAGAVVLTGALALVAGAGSVEAASAAATAAQGTTAAPTLVEAHYRITPDSPTRATVWARLALEGPVQELLVTWFPGQRLTDLQVSADGTPVAARLAPDDGTAIRRIRWSQPLSGILEIRYRLDGSDRYRFRYALPVAPAAPLPGSDVVALEVELPAAARFGGNSFPHFTVTEAGRLHTDLAGAPGFVHVVFEGAAAAASTAAPAAAAPPPPAGPQGFGISFYGFFMFSALWCLGYFVWARRANRSRRG